MQGHKAVNVDVKEEEERKMTEDDFWQPCWRRFRRGGGGGGGGRMLWGGRHGSNEAAMRLNFGRAFITRQGDMRGDLFGIIKRICGSYAET